MARSKSASRRGAAKKAAKTRKSRAAAKKAVATRKRPGTARKAATTKTRRAAGKKAAQTRQLRTPRVAAPSAAPAPVTTELDQRIAIVRGNLRNLMEQASGTSGSASEELLSDRI